MAIEATKIYVKHKEIFDEQMTEFITERPLRDDLKTLKVTASPQESMKINDFEGACLILAGAGMCNAGRILHHLKRNLWHEEARVRWLSGARFAGAPAGGRPSNGQHPWRKDQRAREGPYLGRIQCTRRAKRLAELVQCSFGQQGAEKLVFRDKETLRFVLIPAADGGGSDPLRAGHRFFRSLALVR